MGVRVPLNRKQLIEQHVESMLAWAAEIERDNRPFHRTLRRSEVIERVRECAAEVARAHDVIAAREKACDR